MYEHHLDFSEDGSRLLCFAQFEKPRPEDDGRTALLQLWDTRGGTGLPVSQRSVAQENPKLAWLVGDGDRIAVASSRRKGRDSYLDLHATASGERVRRVYGPEPALNQTPADRGRGVWLVGQGGVRWYALVPGAGRPSGTVGGPRSPI
ncbi:hypothetical protein DN402_16485 [Streptomyces sp. SW4]|nr:hypothetical protein DN402_16485 [Streptomyces sp. SW4]